VTLAAEALDVELAIEAIGVVAEVLDVELAIEAMEVAAEVEGELAGHDGAYTEPQTSTMR